MHIARPLAGRVTEPETKTVLEIGYGGGRLLAAASRAFGKAVGVDVHDCRTTVSAELGRLGVSNVELHCSDGRTLPVSDQSVDVVYSFIVLQHLERLEVHRALLAEAATHGDETTVSEGWGPGLYLDLEAVEALGRRPKNTPTILRSGGAEFFRAGS